MIWGENTLFFGNTHINPQPSKPSNSRAPPRIWAFGHLWNLFFTKITTSTTPHSSRGFRTDLKGEENWRRARGAQIGQNFPHPADPASLRPAIQWNFLVKKIYIYIYGYTYVDYLYLIDFVYIYIYTWVFSLVSGLSLVPVMYQYTVYSERTCVATRRLGAFRIKSFSWSFETSKALFTTAWKVNGWNLQITHLEGKVIWNKPLGNYVPC